VVIEIWSNHDPRGDDDGAKPKLYRRREQGQELGEDRLLGHQGIAEVALQQPAEEIEILQHDMLVVAQLRGQLGMAFRRYAAFARHQQHRVAGQDAHEAEGDDGDAEEGRHQVEKFGKNEPDHGPVP
jgi:hypothetical protein